MACVWELNEPSGDVCVGLEHNLHSSFMGTYWQSVNLWLVVSLSPGIGDGGDIALFMLRD
ncbi:MAG: hypothetical protein ABSF63_06010 [Candidatus Bathyarchaeia archaeon]